MIQSNHIVSPEVFIENRYTYKQQEDYSCFDGDFDNDDDVDDKAGSNVSLRPSIIPITTPTTAVANLLLTLINQVSVTSPPPSPSSLGPFNFSYIGVTPPKTKTDPFTDSDTVISSSSVLAIKAILCDNYGTVILPTTSFERNTPYSLLLSHLLIPSQFIKLSYGEDHYSTVSISKQRLVPTPLSILKTVTKTSISPLQETPSRSVPLEDVDDYLSSFSSLIDIDLMMILTMVILPTILIIILTILPMILLILLVVIGTHEEQNVFPNDTTTDTLRPPTVLMTIFLAVPPSFTFPYKKYGKRKEIRLQRLQFWAFIQQLHYSRIGSSCSGFKWSAAILCKLSMTIWTLWQFHNEGACLSTSA